MSGCGTEPADGGWFDRKSQASLLHTNASGRIWSAGTESIYFNSDVGGAEPWALWAGSAGSMYVVCVAKEHEQPLAHQETIHTHSGLYESNTYSCFTYNVCVLVLFLGWPLKVGPSSRLSSVCRLSRMYCG